MSIVKAILGLAIVLTVLFEAFEALVLPRRIIRPFRFTRLYYRILWAIWSAMFKFVMPRHRQTWLSLFGPFSLLALFAGWAVALIVGFGLVHSAFEHERDGLLEAFYFSGTTFTTLGYGDLTPKSFAGRMIAVAEAATGFGFFAVVVSYLPVLYQAFSRREAFIALFDARAGSPPAAARLLLRIPPVEDGETCLNAFLVESERWAAELLEGHLSFPVLGYYRSQHDNQSWLATLTCILDVSALLLTVVDERRRIQARLTFAMARHAAVDLGLVVGRAPSSPSADRLPEVRLKELLELLRSGGVGVRDDPASLAKFAELRQLYEPFVVGLGSYFHLSVTEVWPVEERPDNWRTARGRGVPDHFNRLESIRRMTTSAEQTKTIPACSPSSGATWRPYYAG